MFIYNIFLYYAYSIIINIIIILSNIVYILVYDSELVLLTKAACFIARVFSEDDDEGDEDLQSDDVVTWLLWGSVSVVNGTCEEDCLVMIFSLLESLIGSSSIWSLFVVNFIANDRS